MLTILAVVLYTIINVLIILNAASQTGKTMSFSFYPSIGLATVLLIMVML